MSEPVIWPLATSIVLFAVAVALIGVFGVRMTIVAQQLAVQTRLGEAIMGAVFVGASTSLSEIVTCTTAALANHPELAVSNAIGSIAGQTAFLAVADMAYRKANLEHAAASAENLILGAFLIALLAIPLLAMSLPGVSIWSVHPVTPVMIVAYVFGMLLVSQTQKMPMWHPRPTRETHAADQEVPGRTKQSLTGLWSNFAVSALFVALSGWLLARTAISISHHTGLSETVTGGLLTGLASSLPELITAVTAVRIGALTLAVGDVLGGNAFDTLLVAISDVAYRQGSIYQALSTHQFFLLALTILLTSILLLGMLHREKHGIANIGLESVLVLALYVGAFTVLIFVG